MVFLLYIYVSILDTPYTSYMFQPLTWPSSGRYITKDRDTVKYYRSFCTDAQIYNFKIIHGLEYVLITYRQKVSVVNSNG